MTTRVSTTFAVSDVRPTTRPLPEMPYHQAVENQSTDFGAGHGPIQIEACSRYHGSMVAHERPGTGRAWPHPVIAALDRAFGGHRPVAFSPDMIWLMLCQGVANHVNANAETLRHHFVDHEGKIDLVVQANHFIKGQPENPWPEVFGEFSRQIKIHVGPMHDRFIPAFSTTGPTERAAAEIVLLDAVQSYFSYQVRTICGIPTVTLEGTPEDWQAVADRAKAFADLGLDWWLRPLAPILQQFVAAANGQVDLAFWRSMYQIDSDSGRESVTGWITTFFPYLHSPGMEPTTHLLLSSQAFQEQMATLKARPLSNEQKRAALMALYVASVGPGGGSPPRGPALRIFPSGLAKAPFVWEYHGQTFAMEFLGGFVGVCQDPTTMCLRPEIGWAVREAPSHSRPPS